MKKTRTRIGSILLALTLVLTLMPITAMAATSVEYLDEDGTLTYTSSEINVTEINTENAPKEWVNGWYVVSGNVTITDRITVNGDVYLILADDCTLNAQKGISVTSGNSLTIYDQSKEDSTDSTVGKLIAGTADMYYAGIGGDRGNNGVYAHGDITINGGSIKAQGGDYAAGIGGGSSVSSKTDPNGTITINGGTVEATGGDTGAGIGCGSANHVAGGDITITGGTVTAQGGNFAAGIGGGKLDDYTPGRNITISGGTVEATGGSQAAGIGSGYDMYGGVNRSIGAIKINGSANVTANGGAGAAGIGSSYEGAATGAILIGGSATVEANGGGSEQDGSGVLAAGAGIGSGGNGGQAGNITINGGTVEATGGTGHLDASGAGIGSGGTVAFSSSGSGDIVISAGTITATGGGTSGTQAAGIGSGSNATTSYESTSGDFSTERNGNPGKAVIYTNSITDDDDTSDWNGIIFQGNEGTVYGDVELNKPLIVKNDQTLTVPEDSSLTTNKKLTVQKTAELDVAEGGLLIVEEEGQLVNNGTLDNDGEVVVFGKNTGNSPNGNPLVTDPVASYVDAGGTTHYYDDLAEAISAASASGGTVTLLKNTALTTAISEKVTLSVPANITLTVDLSTNAAALLDSKGNIVVKSGGIIKVGDAEMIGPNGNIVLNDGEISISYNSKLVMNFADADATVPRGKYWTLALDAGSPPVKMDVTLDSTSILTANGTELRVANGSTLTNNGQITVGTLLTVRSEGTLTGSGTITNNGTIALCASDGKQAALGESTKITLNNNGKVLSQFDVADGKFAGQVTETTGSFSVTDGTNAALTFQYQYTPYVAPETPVTPVVPTTPSTSDKDDDDDDDGYSITIPASSSVRGGSISVNPRRADKGDTVTITVTPDDGYVLKDLTVTARSGGEVDLTKKNSTQYTFKMPAGAVVIEVSFVESDSAAEVEMSFADVAEDFWAYSEIQWAFDNGYMNGTSATTFNPSGTVSRQQVWMILARMAGANPADMAAAKAWAVESGISDGTNPGGGVTRQQLVALLYRFAAQNGYDTNAKADLSGYPDVASLASYAADAMAWSVANGIIGGTTQGTLNPAGTANRAQFAVILWRFYQTTAV